MATKHISRTEAKRLLFETIADDNTIFGVTFTKKDGTERDMKCRRHVKKGVTGAGRKYDPRDYGLLGVYDVEKQGFRMVNSETISRIAFRGDIYLVDAREDGAE